MHVQTHIECESESDGLTDRWIDNNEYHIKVYEKNSHSIVFFSIIACVKRKDKSPMTLSYCKGLIYTFQAACKLKMHLEMDKAKTEGTIREKKKGGKSCLICHVN